MFRLEVTFGGKTSNYPYTTKYKCSGSFSSIFNTFKQNKEKKK